MLTLCLAYFLWRPFVFCFCKADETAEDNAETQLDIAVLDVPYVTDGGEGIRYLKPVIRSER